MVKGPERQASRLGTSQDAEKDPGPRKRTQPVPKQNQSRTEVKVVKTDLIRDYCNRQKRPQHRTRCSSEYNMGEWGFTAKERVGVSGCRLPRGNVRGGGVGSA